MSDTTAASNALVVHPVSGEVITLRDVPTDELALGLKVDLERVAEAVVAARQAVIDEVARRLDRTGGRSAELELDDGRRLKVETNAPTTEVYPFRETREAILELVEREVLDATAIGRVLVYPDPPPAPDPRVDKRAINALKRIPDVARELGRLRRIENVKRTLKVNVSDPPRDDAT
jgi:hypothetical protein